MSGASVLCVDDDGAVRDLLERLVVAAGHDCETVGSVDDARRLLGEQPFAVAAGEAP